MPEELANRIGRHVAKVRGARGMTQQVLADAAELTRGVVSALELGRYPNLGIATLERVCRVLDMTVKEFFDSLPGA